ncbi:MAG: hypothetical protein MJ188_03715 [Treponema sp.]|nr:hypothetical protein [Treponema sp.]
MKKIISIVIIGMLAGGLFGESLTEKVIAAMPADKIVIINHVDYDPKDGPLEKEAVSNHKSILRIQEMTYKTYYGKNLARNLEIPQKVTQTMDSYVEYLKTASNSKGPTSDYIAEKQRIETEDFYIEYSFSTRSGYGFAHPIGSYYGTAFDKKNNMVCEFGFIDYESERKSLEFLDQLKDYIHYEKHEEGLSDVPLSNYYWNDDETIERFYLDMKDKKKTLPKYVLEFQELFETLINAFIE